MLPPPQVVKTNDSELHGWKFHFTDSGIAPAKEVDALADELGLFQHPHIIFNKNTAQFTYKNILQIRYNHVEALRLVNFKARQAQLWVGGANPPLNHISYLPEKLQIKHAEHWKSLKKPTDIQLTKLEDVSDSFFATPFKGYLSQLGQTKISIEKTQQEVIPIQKLGPQNPITFYHQGSIYQDELDDNGLIQYEYKFRTMKDSWFSLIRCYQRVDDVAVIIYDTRLYWENENPNRVARQFMVRRASWEELKQKSFSVQGWTMDPNQSHIVYQYLNTVFVDNEYVKF